MLRACHLDRLVKYAYSFIPLMYAHRRSGLVEHVCGLKAYLVHLWHGRAHSPPFRMVESGAGHFMALKGVAVYTRRLVRAVKYGTGCEGRSKARPRTLAAPQGQSSMVQSAQQWALHTRRLHGRSSTVQAFRSGGACPSLQTEWRCLGDRFDC